MFEKVFSESNHTKPKTNVPKLPCDSLMDFCDTIKKEGRKEISIDEIESLVRNEMLKLQTNALIHAFHRGMNSVLKTRK